MEKEEIVVVKNLCKFFGSFEALKNVSITVRKNTIYGLLGSNGAGKSTLMHILTGLLSYNQGEILIFGQNIKKGSSLFKRKIAIVPQKISLYEHLSIKENLYFFGKAYGLRRKEILKKIDSLNKILFFGNMNRNVAYLSGGYQRRTSLAVSLMGDPDLIILDEALVGIDLETRNTILTFLNQLKKTKTIIITTHSMKDAEVLCDDICFLHRGKKILEGETEEILRDYAKKNKIRINVLLEKEPEDNFLRTIFKNTDINFSVRGKVLELQFLAKNYNVLEVLNHIQSYTKLQKLIKDIEICKPGLEDIMLDLIKSNKD